MMLSQKDIERIQQYDQELLNIIQDFLFLAPLSWPKETMTSFFKTMKKGNIRLPKISYPKSDYQEKIAALRRYIQQLGQADDVITSFLKKTAESYLDAYHVLQGAGTQDVSEFSRKLYGSPKDDLPRYKRCSLDIARYFLRVVGQYHCVLPEVYQPYHAAQFKRLLEKRIKAVMPGSGISVSVDSKISARAAAGSNYVKIRKGARFSDHDLEQLFHHEVMVHTLTYVNGRRQPILKTLGYNAPRTTITQEGLAVFAEYANSCMELDRLQRIALRIIAIDMAEQGADFVDLFRFYRGRGQSDEESYYSAMRIFRGGLPQGGIVFYKDNVYLKGLIEVSSFFKQAMHHGFIHDIALLFCGKLTTEDVLQLKPLVGGKVIVDPLYMPSWAKRSSELAAHLAMNDLTERFKVK